MLFSLPLSLNTVFCSIIYNNIIKYRLDEWKVGQIRKLAEQPGPRGCECWHKSQQETVMACTQHGS